MKDQIKFKTESLAKKFQKDMSGLGQFSPYNYTRKGKIVMRLSK